jgi:hypothetical protein
MSFHIKDKLEFLVDLKKEFDQLLKPIQSACCKKLGDLIINRDPKKLPEPTLCQACGKLLRGIVVHGRACQICKKKYHAECFDKSE